jgi:uncharacterized membrane protein (DUF485 family)
MFGGFIVIKEQVDRRGAWLAVTAVVLIALFQAIWYIAPDVLAQPLWSGSALNIGFLLGTLSMLVPVVVAWLIVKPDSDRPDDETFETSNH